MNQHYSDIRKIDPTRHRPDGTPLDNDRVETGPTPLAFAEWAEAGLPAPDIAAMRAHRLARIVRMLNARDYAGILMFDPLNIRYATDCPNMQLWNAHNPYRACLVTPDGHMILWDFKGCGNLLTAFNPLVRETRPGTSSFFYFSNGDATRARAVTFAAEVDAELRARAPGNRRLAIDKIMVHGVRAFDALGYDILEGEEFMEKARAIKGPDEITAMRCSVHSCERAIAEMEAAMAPGMTEDDVWAELHKGNIRRGGEWIECRLLASGPRTNPWFQECGPRVIGKGEILAFDTDLVGVYGLCTDLSRTWLVGRDAEPTAEMKRLYRIAHDHVLSNMAMLRPGLSFRDIVFGAKPLPEEFQAQKYGVVMHGVGLCDEWPSLPYADSWVDGALDGYVTEPGMMLCVEAYVGAKGGAFGVKLEEQVLITETGHEVLSKYPWDRRFLD
jgi:Xaa-Pro aminopeptidase